MAVVQIPFPSGASWVQDINLEGTVYTMSVRWLVRSGMWVMDIGPSDSDPVFLGLRITKDWPILRAYDYNPNVPQGQFLVVCTSSNCRGDPKRNDFADGSYKLLYVTRDDDPIPT